MKIAPNTPNCNICLEAPNSIFRHLSKEERDELMFEKSCTFQRRSNIIYHEGNRINGFYCVSSGVIKLYKTGIDGKEQIIRFAQKNDIFGYRSVLSGEMACTTAKVITDATLCYISSNHLFKLVKTNPNFSIELMQLACRELGEANKFILDIAQKSVRERLAEVLLLLRETFDLEPDGTLKITLTREELSNIVGTATESVIRLLSEFKQDNLIDINGRKIRIINIKGLQKTGNVYDGH
ncbi:MAG TPA: Crp/Fnr family transcriptional regulator [Bacteroidales bacterium]|nr:Crp/Fnr family transcriptional regulator [Bacteroidales bacterium]